MFLKSFKKLMICCFCVLVYVFPAMAEGSQQNIENAVLKQVALTDLKVVPLTKLQVVKVALLNRAEEGVFQLKMGQSIDLTDRKVLFTFRELYRDNDQSRKDKHIRIYINGEGEYIRQGHRIDLKKHRRTSKYFEGNEECFVDYVDLVAPKGAPAVGTFRVHCE